MSIFRKYYLKNNHGEPVTVDVYGYDDETETFYYQVITKYSCANRKAKKQYKAPDKRNEWIFPYGIYINVILNDESKQRLFLD